MQIGVNFASLNGDLIARATSSEVIFPGFQAVYASKFFKDAQDESDLLKQRNPGLLALKVQIYYCIHNIL